MYETDTFPRRKKGCAPTTATWCSHVYVCMVQFFPADLFLIGVYVALLFFSLLYGLLSLPRLRVFNKTFWNRICPRRTSPEILLILCFFLVHMLLAASLALLTMAPRYASFGSQTFSPQNGSDELPCSLQVAAGSTTIGGEGGTGETYRHKENACQMSFFAAVFSRAAIAYPSFSNFFFFSDWVFLGVYVLCLIHCVLIRTKQPYISTDRWLEEEEQGNHFFEEMREGGGDGGFRGRCQGLHKSTGSKPSNGRFLGMSGRGKGGGVDDDDDENLRLLASDLRRADV
ncbi:lysosomal cobalamin protein [Cystoisospora suis]|uniref:Lysosomal cobalamin protein n=1 Tax=Cystoisospora suis TaxID=483139 RepID=A0A2C6LEG1_9APIC|nr:lysosomal cobalamin protein [Cystoisospora suis]